MRGICAKIDEIRNREKGCHGIFHRSKKLMSKL